MAHLRRMQLLLPVVWGLGCAIGYAHPGDEYAGFVLGSILGTWTLLLTDETSLLLPLLVGCALMWGMGRLLELMKANRIIWTITWLVVAAAFYVWSIFRFESVEHAIAKNGSLAAYLAFASQIGAYAATLVTSGLAAVRAALCAKRTTARFPRPQADD